MQIGVTALPHFSKDTTDRNRTSPFAFTGNKFEFRMIGSAFSVAGPNIILNTIVAESLQQFADHLEGSSDWVADLTALIKETYTAHKRIVFNGNNYADEWVTEAECRGLSNLKTTVDALPEFVSAKSIELFVKHHVFTGSEIHSRFDILMENYCKTIHIEALTMVDMVKGEVIPACVDYQSELSKLLERKKACGEYESSMEQQMLSSISKLSSCLMKKLKNLEDALLHSKEERALAAQGLFYRDKIFAAMSELRLVVDELETLVRLVVDELETLVAKKHWPFPKYAELLYSVI